MFDYCPKIDRECPFCGKLGYVKHCGLIGGSIECSKIERMPKCPKDMTKYEIKKYKQSVL